MSPRYSGDINIVPLYDYWYEPGGNAYLVMRWLRGGSLFDLLNKQRVWDLREIARLPQVGSQSQRSAFCGRHIAKMKILANIGKLYIQRRCLAIAVCQKS